MNVIKALAARFARAISGHSEAVLVRIEDEIAGAPVGWGPEVDEFADELTRITRALGGEFTGRTRTGRGYQLLFQVAHCGRWLAKVEPLLGTAAIGAAVSLFAADQTGAWRPLRREGNDS
jgi:hypothetical protein